VSFLEPFITKRKISVPIQDFCNMLGGGLVSYSTLSAECLKQLDAIPTGVVIATYEFRAEDVCQQEKVGCEVPAGAAHRVSVVCWKGGSRAINVMCGKVGKCPNHCTLTKRTRLYNPPAISLVEIESIKHQLAALGVLRPKIGAVRLVAEAVVGTAGAETVVAEEGQSGEMDADVEGPAAV
jgi:hypothetical protein